MKYAKQVPREFVPFEYSEVTLENIKRACEVHYRENLTTSDILTSTQGSSCSRLDQIPVSKVIYVRFIMPESGKSILSETLELDPFQCQPQHKRMWKSVISHSVISPANTAKSIASSVVPQSLSTVDTLKFGEDHQTCTKENSQCWG